MNTVFDHLALEYDDWFVRNESAYRSELAAIKAFMPKEGCGLEIGVGTGRFAASLGIEVGVEPALVTKPPRPAKPFFKTYQPLRRRSR